MKKLLLPIMPLLISVAALAQVCHADLNYAANGPGVYPFSIATPNCGDTLATKTIISITDTTVHVTSPITIDVTIYYDSTRVMSVSYLPPGLSFGTDVDGFTTAHLPYGAWVNGGTVPNIEPAIGCVYVHGPQSAWLAAQSGGDTGVYIIQVEYDARIVKTSPDVSNYGVPNGTWLSDVSPQYGGGSIFINVPLDTDPGVQFELGALVGDTVIVGATPTTYTATPGAAAYDWTVIGGTIVSGDSTNAISVEWALGNDTGSVTVVAGNGESCDQVEQLTVTDLTAGIFDRATLNSRIYPNPSNGIFNVEMETTGVVNLSVMDMAGKVVHAESYVSAVLRLDLSALQTGVYILKLETNDGWAISKLILE